VTLQTALPVTLRKTNLSMSGAAQDFK
jgi:hypothetical protein